LYDYLSCVHLLAGYVDGINKALDLCPELQGWTLTEIIKKAGTDAIPEKCHEIVKTAGGGAYNHNLW
jgi:hypothetical protein